MHQSCSKVLDFFFPLKKKQSYNHTNRPIAIGFCFNSSFKKIIMTLLSVGLEIFFICHKLSFILCGAMTTNEIMGFSYVLIASPQNQYVIIKLFKGWIKWNSLLQKVYWKFAFDIHFESLNQQTNKQTKCVWSFFLNCFHKSYKVKLIKHTFIIFQ